MDRRTFLAGSLGASLVPFMNRLAFAAGKPVTWWYESAAPAQQEAIAKVLVAGFNAAHPDHSLAIDYRGSELDKQMRVALLSGNGPDVVYTAGPSYVAPMARAGQLLPLDDYAEKLGWNKRILPVFLEMGKYDGKLYAVPKTYETLGLFYNKAVLEKNGWKAPTTIAEMEALADEALKAKLVPFASGNAGWRGNNEHYVTIVFNSIAGPENVYKALKGEIPWTAEPFVAAINKLNDWWQKGYFGPDYFSLETEQFFAQMAAGKSPMLPSGTWHFQYIQSYFKDKADQCGFVGFPSAEGIGAPVYALGVGSTLSIAAAAQNPDGAAAAIDYVFSPEFYGAMNSVWQGEWNTPLEDLSMVRISDAVPALYADTMKTLADAVGDNKYGYTSWTFLPPATDTQLINGIEEVWLGRATVADYLAQLDTTFQQEKAEGKVPAVPAR